MSVITTLPSDVRAPGVFNEFDDVSGSKGLAVVTRRLLLAGIWDDSLDDGRATVDVPFQVFDESDADNAFGKQSDLALMCRAAFSLFAKYGVAAQVWGLPVADPGGVAHVQRFACSGTATESGDVVIEVNGQVVRAGVTSGDAAAAVATALVAAYNAVGGGLGLIPGTAAVATSVNCDVTFGLTGTWGSETHFKVVSAPAGITVTPSATASGSGDPDYTTPLANSLTRDYLAVAISGSVSNDITDVNTHVDAAWGETVKRYRHVFIGETGNISAATTHAAAANRKNVVVVSAEAYKAQTGEIAAQVAGLTLTREKPNQNWNGYALTIKPADEADRYISSEIETALAGGTTPLSVNDSGETIVVRLVTTKTTENSVSFENLLDIGPSKTMALIAKDVEAKVSLMLQDNNIDDSLLRDIYSAVYAILAQREEDGWIHNVDAHKNELIIAPHPTVATRIVAKIPESVVPIANQFVGVHTLFIEAPV
jgi:phage tail sheath gpL-like